MNPLLVTAENLLKYNRLSLLLFRILGSSPKTYARDKLVRYDKNFTRFDLINHLIKENGFSRYLEIGVSIPSKCFDRIQVQTKMGVDPDASANASHVMTSDEFFEKNKEKFDIIQNKLKKIF